MPAPSPTPYRLRAERKACDIRIRAERRLGELLAAGQRDGTLANKHDNRDKYYLAKGRMALPYEQTR